MKKALILLITIFCLSNSYSQIVEIDPITFEPISKSVDTNGYPKETEEVQKMKDEAYIKQQLMDSAGAILLYDKIIELSPKNPANYFQRGNLKYWASRYEECIKDMNFSIKLNPNDATDAYYYKALANIKLNRLQTVCKDLKKGYAAECLLKKYCK
ncbi:tetratricopeptide repeat protein [Flavobacterium psychrophilum]|uniref:Tetratricopeptide repeat protein n=1 Tax=Flavobacterium psychrophilum TaxID=96345 RepID=A0A7U2NE76_FLAPS|nr:hypothetical protein [Flavobacterium psychrophilum]QRE03550.1 hypothetical protein H0H26_11770 [Flavobacterium psychrophilum]